MLFVSTGRENSPILSNSKHSGLGADVSQIGTVESIRKLSTEVIVSCDYPYVPSSGDTHLHHRLVIDFSTFIHILRVDFQDLHPSLLVRKRDFNLPVETTRTKKGGIKSIWSIGSHDELRSTEGIESVHLIEKLGGGGDFCQCSVLSGWSKSGAHLHQRSLYFPIGASSLREPSSTDSVNLVHENDTWFMFTSVREHLPDQTSGFTNVFVDDLERQHDLMVSCIVIA